MAKAVIILLLLCAFNLKAQDSKRFKFKTQIERCLVGGLPVADCIPLSDIDGKFSPHDLSDILNELNSLNESAVDSIWTNTAGDTLFISYFDAPTLKFKASGLNGLYSSSNQSKTFGVTQATVGASGLNLSMSSGGGSLKINGISNSPLNPTAQTSQGYLLYGLPNASNKAVIATTASSQVWQFGSNTNIWSIIDQTHSGLTVFKINPVGVNTSPASNYFNLQGDGDFDFSAYKAGSRTPITNWLNIATFKSDGQLDIATKQTVIDTLNNYIMPVNTLTNISKQFEVLDECVYPNAFTIVDNIIPYGTNGSSSTVSSTQGNIIGVRRHTTQSGTTSGTGTLVGGSISDGITLAKLGEGSWVYETYILNFSALANSTDNYCFYSGFVDMPSGLGNYNMTDGVAFLYDSLGTVSGSLQSDKWQCVTMVGGTATFQSSGIPVTTNPVKLKIFINSDASQADFYIDGTLVKSINTNIPTGNSNSTGIGVSLRKNGGTTPITFDLDYLYCKEIYNTEK